MLNDCITLKLLGTDSCFTFKSELVQIRYEELVKLARKKGGIISKPNEIEFCNVDCFLAVATEFPALLKKNQLKRR